MAHKGQLVIVTGLKFLSMNDAEDHPAIVTRVWPGNKEHETVNLLVFPDNGSPQVRTSVPFFDDEASAAKFRDPEAEIKVMTVPEQREKGGRLIAPAQYETQKRWKNGQPFVCFPIDDSAKLKEACLKAIESQSKQA